MWLGLPPLLELTIYAVIAGAIGGVLAALQIENRSQLPKTENQGNAAGAHPPGATPPSVDEAAAKAAKNAAIPRRGWNKVQPYIYHVFIGAIAAGASWLAYGPYSGYYLVGGPTSTDASAQLGMTATQLVAALFVGFGGTKWLQSERDKGQWQATADSAATSAPSPKLAQLLRAASSDQAPQIAAAAAEATP